MFAIRASAALFFLAVLAGCSSTEVTPTRPYEGGALPRPGRILVEDFGAAPSDVAPESKLAAEAAGSAPRTPEDVELGRRLGAEVARQLVLDLQAMGLPAVQAADAPPLQPTTSPSKAISTRLIRAAAAGASCSASARAPPSCAPLSTAIR